MQNGFPVFAENDSAMWLIHESRFHLLTDMASLWHCYGIVSDGLQRAA